jgi:two-component system, OmpR family, response regulator RegX3
MNVAILDDDAYQRQLLTLLVETGGHVATSFERGADLIQALERRSFDVLLLDWVMPAMSGADVLAALGAQPALDLPVIVVTSRDAEVDVVSALRHGADDYIVKPPKGMELLARMEAVSRRARSGRAAPIRAGRFEIDLDRRTISLEGRTIDLTQKEFDLAVYFFQHPGTLLSRTRLLEKVWGISSELDTRTVDTHASRLRRKLGLDTASGWRLLPVYGFGYRLEPVDAA